MIISITNELSISGAPAPILESLERELKFLNPQWAENERRGRWNRDTPKFLAFYEKTPTGRMIIPRGYIRQLILLCRHKDVPYEIQDWRRTLPEVSFDFKGRLKPFQEMAVDRMFSKEFGTLSAPTGSGKTVIALYMTARRKQPALVVVHTKDLAFQWIERIEEFLGIPSEEVGIIGDGKKKIGSQITVALVQTLYRCAREVIPQVGYLIVDECHRTPSRTFTDAVSAFDSRYMLGLTATPWRRDKLSQLIFWHLGDVHHSIEQADLIEEGHILGAKVIIRETDFQPYYDPTLEYSKMLSELTADDQRNRLIAGDVAHESQNAQGVCLVLSDRKKHCETLQSLLKYKHHIEAEVLTGDLTMPHRRQVMDRINQGVSRILIATGQLIGEGFDCKGLSTLFIATPIKFSGRLTQYVGRILRTAPGKTRATVYDYVDVKVGPLMAASFARQKVYRSWEERRPEASTT